MQGAMKTMAITRADLAGNGGPGVRNVRQRGLGWRLIVVWGGSLSARRRARRDRSGSENDRRTNRLANRAAGGSLPQP